MAARLVHHGAAQVIVSGQRIAALLEDGGAGQFRITRRHDADRLSGGVQIVIGKAQHRQAPCRRDGMP
jgi:hypothetical protein